MSRATPQAAYETAREAMFVPAGEVMAVAKREQAIPYDVPGVELGHHREQCSFDAFLQPPGPPMFHGSPSHRRRHSP